eukprot:10397945-Alexandrium_andersonii.AAC.1
MTDRAVFQVDLGNIDQFKQEVIAWGRRWQPDQVAVDLMQSVPLEALCVVLGRPSGWGEVGAASRALATSPKRARK